MFNTSFILFLLKKLFWVLAEIDVRLVKISLLLLKELKLLFVCLLLEILGFFSEYNFVLFLFELLSFDKILIFFLLSIYIFNKSFLLFLLIGLFPSREMAFLLMSNSFFSLLLI